VVFSPGQDKKEKASSSSAASSSVGFSFGNYWGQAASFLENVGEVVSSVSDYVAPLSDDELEESRDEEDRRPEGRDEEEEEEEEGGRGSFFRVGGWGSGSGSGGSNSSNRQNAEDKHAEHISAQTPALAPVPVPVVQRVLPPAGSAAAALSAPKYDPRFTAATDAATRAASAASSRLALAQQEKMEDVMLYNPAASAAASPPADAAVATDKHVLDLTNVSLSSPVGSPSQSPQASAFEEQEEQEERRLEMLYVHPPAAVPAHVHAPLQHSDHYKEYLRPRVSLDLSQESLDAWDDGEGGEGEEGGGGWGDRDDEEAITPHPEALPFSFSSTAFPATAPLNIVPAPAPGPEPEPASSLSNELEQERSKHGQYRSGVEAKLESLLAQAMQSQETITGLETELAASRAHNADLEARLQVLAAQPPTPPAAAVDVQALRHDARRLESALQASEDSLKEHEELLWQSKAENSELLYAINGERDEMAAVLRQREQLQSTVADLSQGLERAECRISELSVQLADAIAAAAAAAQAAQSQAQAAAVAAFTASRDPETPPASHSSVEPDRDVALARGAEANTQHSAELQVELETLQAQVRHAREAYQLLDSQAKILQDDLTIERNERADSAATCEAMTKQLKQMEQEKAQLQLVITQLRTSKRSTREDTEAVVAERDDLLAKVASLQAAWTRDSQALVQYTQQAEHASESSGHLQYALQKVQSEYREAQISLQLLQAHAQELEKNNYDLNALCGALQADMLLLQQEAERRLLEVSNLHKAMQQMQHEQGGGLQRGEQERAQLLALADERHEAELARERCAWEQQLAAEKEEVRQIRQRAEDESLLRRKAQLDLNAEKRSMQATLENTLSQLRNSADDAVDRQLVANLFVSYLRKGRPAEVLDLISKILGFTDSQMESVGLLAPKRHFISAIFSTLVGDAQEGQEALHTNSHSGAPAGESLAELWVSFLEAEASQPGQGQGQGQGQEGEGEEKTKGGGGGGGGAAEGLPKRAGRPMPSIGVAASPGTLDTRR